MTTPSVEPTWTPSQHLIDDLRVALGHAPRATPEQRFEAWAWRALLDEEGPGLLTRRCAPSHVTASGLVLSPDARRTCLVLHGRINLWVQPGGHLEATDSSIAGAAAREVAEETGLRGRVLSRPTRLSRHYAPCRAEVDWHLDLQFTVVADALPPQLSSESHDVRWWPVDALPDDVAPDVAEGIADAVRHLRTELG